MASCHFSLHLNILAQSGLKNRWTSGATTSRIQPPDMYLVFGLRRLFFYLRLILCKGIRIPECGKSLLVEWKSWAMEPGIQLAESAIPFTFWIQNPCSIDKDWNPVPGIRNPRPSVHRGVSRTPNGLPASEKQRNKVSFFVTLKICHVCECFSESVCLIAIPVLNK